MLKSTFVQQSAHNLHERREVSEALQVRGQSRVRIKYLKNRLNRLNKEKAFFIKIKSEFRLTDKDCYKI